MSLLQYLQLQPIDPQDDGTVSDLDDFPQDEVIDLTEEDDGDTLAQSWEEIDETLHSMSVTDDDSTS
ncbi:hypothetical protein BGO18_01130 [Candidatus Saccharibacteria bacterium 47-87]|jgi:hypothetical protein|nr:hypothetical protein [Candidatus Saccharibacteria bacterium]OJU96771.1 MAG: hypothetical protein BGO18_01130 [Candidatus Saccharibacteria bacterium 47-87]